MQIIADDRRTSIFSWYNLAGSFATACGALAGGFVLQGIVAYWFHVRYGVAPGLLGSIFFVANILAGLSAL